MFGFDGILGFEHDFVIEPVVQFTRNNTIIPVASTIVYFVFIKLVRAFSLVLYQAVPGPKTAEQTFESALRKCGLELITLHFQHFGFVQRYLLPFFTQTVVSLFQEP